MGRRAYEAPLPLRSRQIADDLVRAGVVAEGDRDRAGAVLARHVDVGPEPSASHVWTTPSSSMVAYRSPSSDQ